MVVTRPSTLAASLLLAVARASVPACPTPRNVYIDAGVNWCNSLLIFKSVPEARARLAEPWHIFGFEANKRIAPYADLCHRALSAGQPLPTPPIPPAGSTRDLARYAARYNCSKVQLGLRPASEHDRKVYKRQLLVPCMQRALAHNLASIHADPALSDNASLLQHRLSLGASCDALERSRYVFLPAAVGEKAGALALGDNPVALITGGNRNAKNVTKYHAAMIDFSSWMGSSFAPSDFVVLKLDVEGAEHAIIPKMIADGTLGLVDVLLWECHHLPFWRHSPCHRLLRSVRDAGVSTIYQDPYPWAEPPVEQPSVAQPPPAR